MSACLVAWIVSLIAAAMDVEYTHEQPAFALRLPAAEWQTRDQSGGGALVMIFTPDADMATRCCVLALPVAVLPEGLKTREVQIRESVGRAYQKVAFETVEAFGRTVTRWEYQIAGATTIEWGFVDGASQVVFQLAAPDHVWADADRRAELDALRESFVWGGGEVVVKAVPIDLTPPAQIRAARAAGMARLAARSFEVVAQRIVATVEPDAHSLAADCSLEIAAHADVASLDLYTSVVTIDRVECAEPMTWEVAPDTGADRLTLRFEPPIDAGGVVRVNVHLHADDYFLGTDQQLVAEIGVLGQVRPHSSWSSHVVWYPIEEVNDAAMDITFDVPDGLVAVTGGRLVDDVSADGRRRQRYVDANRRRRILPHGFAIGAYQSKSVATPGKLDLTVYGFAGEEKRIDQRIDALLDAADLLERALGPLPWSEVRFVHVTPENKETGVSLPGMILVSDRYFPDLDGVDLSDGDLGNSRSLGLLVVADELSHQWNIYAADLPNELGEGFSTFTNALFVEARHGVEAYRKTLASCRRAWLGQSGVATEYAIANPQVYSNTRYRSVVFCKTPLVLDQLRRRLGDEVFFAGLRLAFADDDRSADGFDRLERGFSSASGADQRPFFEQWFFRAGAPTIAIEHAATPTGVRVRVRQTQAEAAFDVDVELAIRCADGAVVAFVARSTEAVQSFEVPLPAAVVDVAIATADVIPARID